MSDSELDDDDILGLEQTVWFEVPVSGLTDAMMDRADQASLFTARRSVDSNYILLSYSVSRVPVAVGLNYPAIDDDDITTVITGDRWAITGVSVSGGP